VDDVKISEDGLVDILDGIWAQGSLKTIKLSNLVLDKKAMAAISKFMER